ncbi:hypothetical protein HY251_09400 [bacterium]|nr:hypothetical protein [bacterium]
MGLPLLWRFLSPGSERFAFLPFFDYAKDATRLRLVSPVFYHHEDYLEPTSSTVVLGLYWDMRRGPDRIKVAFPLWWDFENTDAKTELSTAFPFFWRYQGESEQTCVLLNSAWTTGKTDRGSSWSFHLFPLFDLGSDSSEHFRWQVLGGLVGHERSGSLHRWRVGFVWTDPSS